MRIVQLQAANVKHLKVVEITPDGTLQIVTGSNAAGKSSVLDAIWLAVGGGAASRQIQQPVREGAKSAFVTLDLGDLRVERTWTAEGKTSLTVTDKHGTRQQPPQAVLDRLFGKLSFDPLEFVRKTPAAQRQQLLDMVGIDFTEQDQQRAALFDERRDTKRRATDYGDLPELAEDAPIEETSAAEILDRIRVAADVLAKIDAAQNEALRLADSVERAEAKIAELREGIETLRENIAERQAFIDNTPDPEDVDALYTELSGIEEHNMVTRDNARIHEAHLKKVHLLERADWLTAQMAAIDTAKTEAIAAAKMPIDGLGFNDDGVTYNGIPFTQASSAEQIQVSAAIAMALSPELRVMLIHDGSLLDAQAMTALATMAKAEDYQVWVERVEDDSPTAIVIEDGTVVTR